MSSAAEPVVVCVLGMHRSGTSLLTRLLNHTGLALGEPGRLARAAADNPRGFWEHEGLRAVNDALLHSFGGSWMFPPDLPAGWLRDPRVESVRALARDILSREFEGVQLWGFKDPRTSLLVDFWRELLPGRIAWIVAVRNPLEVSESLKRRNGFPSVLAEDLWYAYTRAALLGTRPGERSIVHYEQLLAQPVEEVLRLIRELNLPCPRPDAAAVAAMREEASVALRHHSHGMEEVARSEDLLSSTRELYQRLWQGQDPGSLEPTEQLGAHGVPRPFAGLRREVARLVDEQERMRSALTDHEQQATEARTRLTGIEERHEREVSEWREEAIQLRHENQLLKLRAEHRFGERLRRVCRRLRSEDPQA